MAGWREAPAGHFVSDPARYVGIPRNPFISASLPAVDVGVVACCVRRITLRVIRPTRGGKGRTFSAAPGCSAPQKYFNQAISRRRALKPANQFTAGYSATASRMLHSHSAGTEEKPK
ncbi:Uncharacterised protein [Enterobacter cloacae]|nr:Uncharacterised protein [Enterobacter cloacae]